MNADWSRFWLVLFDEVSRMWWIFGVGVFLAAFIKTFKWDKKIRKRLAQSGGAPSLLQLVQVSSRRSAPAESSFW